MIAGARFFGQHNIHLSVRSGTGMRRTADCAFADTTIFICFGRSGTGMRQTADCAFPRRIRLYEKKIQKAVMTYE